MNGDLLRVERGHPDPVELAALVAVLTAGGSAETAPPHSGVRRWTGRPGAGAAWSAGSTTVGRPASPARP